MAQLLPAEKPPLCKGRWVSAANSEGLSIPQSAPQTAPFTQGGLLCYNNSRKRGRFCESFIRMPRQDLSQVTDAKLYNAIPPFATGLPLLYYSLTTLQNNHICPNMTKITAASITEAAVFIYSINWNLSIPITIKIFI